jgi:putative oxidoreductase
MHAVRGLLSVLARLMLTAIFLLSAVAGKIMNFGGTVEKMAAEGVPSPTILLGGAIAFLILGSLSIVLGYKGRFGAFLLLCFLGAATYYFHDFWSVADAGQRQLQTIQFMKNMAIAGGLMSLMAFGGGPWSVDGWITSKREEAESGATAKPRVTAKPADRG